MSKTYKATVVVAPREGGHDGWFDGGRHWPAGKHEDVELTAQQANSLARRPGVLVLVGGKVVEPQESAGGQTAAVTTLTPDELAELEKYRAQKARMAEAAKGEEELQFSKEKRNAALERTLSTPSGGIPGVSADTPLQDSDILHGKPPPENAASSAKPIEHGKKK